MTDPTQSVPDPSKGPEIERLRRLSKLPQAMLDMNFAHQVGELRTGIEALYLTVLQSQADQAIILDEHLRRTWSFYIVLMMQVARHLSVSAELIDTGLQTLLAIQ